MSGRSADHLRHHRCMRDNEPPDEIDAVLAEMESDLGPIAEITREAQGPGFVTLSVAPRNPKARPIWLCYADDEIIIEAGSPGGRWELQRTPEDVAFLIDLVQSITAGRVREILGPKRSRLEVTLADGTTVAETGYRSVVPRPGWRRRGPTVEYESYTGSTK